MRNPWAHAALDGLQLAAAAVVANAVRLMHRQLSPDLPRSILAVFSLIFVLSFPSSAAQLWAILLAGAVGALLWKQGALPASKLCLPISKRAAAASLLLFAILFVSVEALGRFSPARSVQVLRAFYQSGALVFGGGHVVLPLLQEAVVRPGWISESDFLAGYGAAQAIPGPLFTVAAYLGYLLPHPPNRVPGALLCLVGLFLPGLLLAFAVPPHWQKFQQHKRMRSAIAAINASVVGLLAAALVKILTAVSFHHPIDILLTAVDFVLLWRGQVSPLAIVLGSAAAMVLWARFLH